MPNSSIVLHGFLWFSPHFHLLSSWTLGSDYKCGALFQFSMDSVGMGGRGIKELWILSIETVL